MASSLLVSAVLFRKSNVRTDGQCAASAKSPNLRRTSGMGSFAQWSGAIDSDQLVLVCVGRCGRPRRKGELGEDVADVPVDGPSAHEQLGGDDPCWSCRSRSAEAPAPRAGSAHEAGADGASFVRAFKAGEIRRGSQLFEPGSGRVKLQTCSLLVRKGAAGQSHQQTRACGHVRRLDLLPHLQGSAQRAERSLSVAFGQFDSASRHARQSHQRRPVSKRSAISCKCLAGGARVRRFRPPPA